MMSWTRRSRHLSDEDLSAHLDGELNPARRAVADAHLAACAQCVTALEELQEVAVLISRLPAAEPRRSFVLSPQFADVQPQRPLAARRSPFVFAPAAALTVLVALFAVDLASSGSTISDKSAAGGQQAMVARDASSSAGVASESAERAASPAFAAPSPQAALQPTQVPTPATGGNPATAPSAAQGTAPPTPAGQAPSAASGPAIASEAQAVPSTNGPVTGQSVLPPTPAGQAPPAAGGPGIASPGPPPNTGAADSLKAGQDENTAPAADRLDSGASTDWLRIGQALAAIAFVASALIVFVPGLLRKGP